MVVDIRDGLACELEAFLGSFVFLALEGVDLDLEFELAPLELVDGFGSGLTSDTNAREKKMSQYKALE